MFNVQNKMKWNDLCFIFSVKCLLILRNKRNTFTYNITNAKINNNHLHHARSKFEKQTCCQQFSCLGWICLQYRWTHQHIANVCCVFRLETQNIWNNNESHWSASNTMFEKKKLNEKWITRLFLYFSSKTVYAREVSLDLWHRVQSMFLLWYALAHSYKCHHCFFHKFDSSHQSTPTKAVENILRRTFSPLAHAFLPTTLKHLGYLRVNKFKANWCLQRIFFISILILKFVSFRDKHTSHTIYLVVRLDNIHFYRF